MNMHGNKGQYVLAHCIYTYLYLDVRHVHTYLELYVLCVYICSHTYFTHKYCFVGLAVNEYMNWTQQIANKMSRTLGVMNRLKRYLPFSPMKLMYDSLILSHLQFGITNWGFEWERISKLQKRTLSIMTNSSYNAHTEPLFKKLNLLRVKDIFDIQCLKFWYKFVNNKLPNHFRDMFTFIHDRQ